MIKCPRCGGSLGWKNRKTEWACFKCNIVLAILKRDNKSKLFFECALCNFLIGYPLYSCNCWKIRTWKIKDKKGVR